MFGFSSLDYRLGTWLAWEVELQSGRALHGMRALDNSGWLKPPKKSLTPYKETELRLCGKILLSFLVGNWDLWILCLKLLRFVVSHEYFIFSVCVLVAQSGVLLLWWVICNGIRVGRWWRKQAEFWNYAVDATVTAVGTVVKVCFPNWRWDMGPAR